MRTTIRLADSLHTKARREAARRGTTLGALVEEGLRHVLFPSGRQYLRHRADLPVCDQGGGVQPGVDLNDSADLLDRMDPP